MSAQFTSHLPEWRRKHEAAVDAALVAAAYFLVNEIKKELTAKGYTSGAFRNTLLRRNRLRVGQPFTENGKRGVRLGVISGIKNPANPAGPTVGEIMLFWELGHVSLYTGRYERKEIFRPTAVDKADQVRTVFVDTYRARMAA